MLWLSDYSDEIGKAKEYATQPERFIPCTGGWLLEGNHHRHFIRMREDGLQCSCETFKRKVEAGQLWCEHTRAIEMMIATGILKIPISATAPTIDLPSIFSTFAPT